MNALFTRKSKEATKKAPRVNEEKNTSAKTNGGVEMIRRVGLRPLLTEKGVDRQILNQAIFRVTKTATKYQIAEAIEAMYNVKPGAIRTIQMKPKTRRRGATRGKTVAWKKAYVTVPDIKALNIVP